MTLTLKPELAQWIQSEVAAGHYPSAEALVEAALTDRMTGAMDETLDEEDLAAIAEADADADRGDVIDFDVYRAQMMKSLNGDR
jgi:Arc/MetJ-type ribon-helix-helix transcriptional regulator